MILLCIMNCLWLLIFAFRACNGNIEKVKLNSSQTISCPDSTDDYLEFRHQYFNKSIEDIDHKNDLNKTELDSYFGSKKFVTNHTILEHAKFEDSGRLFCIYQSNFTGKYSIISILYSVYDSEEVLTYKHEKFTLSAEELITNSGSIEWYYMNKDQNKLTELKNTSHVIINSDKTQVAIDEFQYDMIYIINTLNGAHIEVNITCIDCSERFSKPIITPALNQSALVGSNVEYRCETAQTFNLDNYYWYKTDSINHTSLLVHNGQYLLFQNVNLTDSGWYMCCPIYSNQKLEQLSCSSTYLKVDSAVPVDASLNQGSLTNTTRNKWEIIVLFVVLVLAVLSATVMIAMFLYKKLIVLKYTHEGNKHMHKNQFYHIRMPTFSINTQETDSKQTGLIYDDGVSQIQLRLSKADIDRWNIPIDHLKFGSILGKGAFGIVMYGEFDQTLKEDTKRPVAIKKLKENASRHNLDDLFEELHTMLQVGEHRNIVNLVGFSFDTSLYIVTEYAKYGNLKEYIRKNDESKAVNPIQPVHMLLYAYQIASGMDYLHAKKVLHRDLAARNILVAEHNLVKIADFGLARNIHTDYYYVQQADGRFPIKWMAPEALKYNKINKKSDIWSYGVLLWEIYSFGCSPYPSVAPERMLELLTTGYRLDRPTECSPSVYKQMLDCWNMNPKSRPSFSQLKTDLERLLDSTSFGYNLQSINHIDNNSTVDISNKIDRFKDIDTTSSSASLIDPFNSTELNVHQIDEIKMSQQNTSVCTSLPSSMSSYAFTESTDCDTTTSNQQKDYKIFNNVFVRLASNDSNTNKLETKPFLNHTNSTPTRIDLNDGQCAHENDLIHKIRRAFSLRNRDTNQLNTKLFGTHV